MRVMEITRVLDDERRVIRGRPARPVPRRAPRRAYAVLAATGVLLLGGLALLDRNADDRPASPSYVGSKWSLGTPGKGQLSPETVGGLNRGLEGRSPSRPGGRLHRSSVTHR